MTQKKGEEEKLLISPVKNLPERNPRRSSLRGFLTIKLFRSKP
jgi:hypothetical protein